MLQELKAWLIAGCRKLQLSPPKLFENGGNAGFTALYATWNLTAINCVVASVLEWAERKNCSRREDSIGYLCSKWLSLI